MDSEKWSPLAKVYDPVKCSSIDGTDADVHDKAVIRALKSSYKPNKGVAGDKDHTLFIGRLSLKTEERTLETMLSKYGPFQKLTLVHDIVTGYSKGYAFVEYEDSDTIKEAYIHAHGLQIDGSTILVEYEHERQMPGWVPRRLGGGLGGKKESGQLRFGGRDRPFKKPIQHSSHPYLSEKGQRSGFDKRRLDTLSRR